MVLKKVNCQAGLQASYISSLLACVFEVLVVKGVGGVEKSEAGRVKRDRRLGGEKNGPALTTDFQTACRL